ncbi:hypothetical protein ACTFSP_28840 [Bacillus cereus group sp. MYBK108-2]|uniref:hypothetical protein n=1 Tax=Bacillus cereus group TaxID=86661 RepID=UPI00115517E3|nr:hypothetical protein [Bacillus cereus]MDA2497678.1 hypothetical protein [Bacillus cereus]MRC31930.1 hypothetical protein [Bacillus thuringiensis]
MVGFIGGYNNVIHPYTHIAVVSLKNKIKEQHLNGSEPLENDNNLHSISYEIFAEGCEPVKGTISVSLKEIFSF